MRHQTPKTAIDPTNGGYNDLDAAVDCLGQKQRKHSPFNHEFLRFWSTHDATGDHLGATLPGGVDLMVEPELSALLQFDGELSSRNLCS